MVVDPTRVQELIVSYGHNYVQAIKALQSRYKKDLKLGSPFLMLTLADLFARLRDFDNAETHLQKFFQSKDIPIDRENLEKLYNVTTMINKRKGQFAKTVGVDVLKVFEAAAKKQKPTGGLDDPFIVLFRMAASHHNWKDTQTASRQLRQRYPKESGHFFLFIACCELASKSSASDEQFFKLAMQKTASTMLSKAAMNTMDGLDSFERIADLRQFHLLTQVYQSAGRYSDLLDLLEHGEQLRAGIPGLQAEELQTLQLEALSNLKESRKLFETCFKLLSDSIERKKDETADERTRTTATNWVQSWNVWRYIVEALEGIEDYSELAKAKSNFEQLIDDVEALEAKRFYEIRPALLAKLTAATKPKLLYQNLCDLACRYFEKSSTEPTCFTDLRGILPYMTEKDLGLFFEETLKTVKAASLAETHRKQYAPVVHHLHLRYLLKISKPEKKSAAEINVYIHECLNLIKKGSEQGHKNIGASFLAAIGLIHLAFQGNDEEPKLEHLLQAAYILNTLGTDMRFPAAQLLGVKLHLYLGLGSIASLAYHKLKIKNIVVDSLGCHMYARVSILNPLGPGPQVTEYSSMAEELTAVLTKTYTDNINGEWKKDPIKRWKKGLPQCDAFLDIAEQETRLDKSLTRAIMRVENRRCQRISAGKYEDNDPPIDKIDELHDGTEYLPAWCIGWADSEHQFFDLVQGGPRIGKHWLAAFILADDTSSLIWGQHSMVPTTIELEQILAADGTATKLSAETTEAEYKALEGWRLLRACTKKILDKTVSITNFKDDVDSLSNWMKDNLPLEKDSPKFFGKALPQFNVLPTKQTYQSIYLTEDLIWSAMQLFLIRLPAALREDEKRLRKHVDAKAASDMALRLMNSFVNISEILTSLRTSVDKNTRKGIVSALNTELGKEIQIALAERDLDVVVDNYLVSARESLNNCLKVNTTQQKWIWSSSGGQAILAPAWKGQK